MNKITKGQKKKRGKKENTGKVEQENRRIEGKRKTKKKKRKKQRKKTKKTPARALHGNTAGNHRNPSARSSVRFFFVVVVICKIFGYAILEYLTTS